MLRSSDGSIRFAGCTPKAVTAGETYGYDDLQRLLGASRAWQGITPSPLPSSSDTYSYDDLGNITSKSDYGLLYLYGNQARTTSLAGPHAVISISNHGAVKARFKYDENGNLTQGDGRTISFENQDRPDQVTMNGYTTQFRYTPDGERYIQSAKSSVGTTNEYYVGKMYERIEDKSSTIERTYVSDPVMIVRRASLRTVRYRHLDRLGSLDAVTDAKAFEDPADAHGYDAFGKPRARDWQSSGDQMQPNEKGYTVERGFTGHEHLDQLYLIHMNGRIYDYRLGRFLSVDPIISNPVNSQSINPYSYIGNNPLSGVDPTGYMECGGGSESTTGTNICGAVPIGNLSIDGTPITSGMIDAYNSWKSGNGSQGPGAPAVAEAETAGAAATGKQSKEQAQESQSSPTARNIPRTLLMRIVVGATPDAGVADGGFQVVDDKTGGKGDVSAVNEALAYLSQDPGLKKIIDDARRKGVTVRTTDDVVPGGANTDDSSKTITWNPHQALQVPTTLKTDAGTYGIGIDSPAFVLGHELAHLKVDQMTLPALQGDDVHLFHFPVEKKIIRDVEQPATKILTDEARRVGHYSAPLTVPYTVPPNAGVVRRDAGVRDAGVP